MNLINGDYVKWYALLHKWKYAAEMPLKYQYSIGVVNVYFVEIQTMNG